MEITSAVTFRPGAGATGSDLRFGGSGTPPFPSGSPPPVWPPGSSPTFITPALPLVVPSATVALPSQSAVQSNAGPTAALPPFVLPQISVSAQYSLTTLPMLQKEKPPTSESMCINLFFYYIVGKVAILFSSDLLSFTFSFSAS